ncbi:hypothetical protein MUJ63_01900 [Lachnospiraceae bacterium NSJ-143]|nr:hypothetical protein [Lachnospiraceae bacterium NSJ-143]
MLLVKRAPVSDVFTCKKAISAAGHVTEECKKKPEPAHRQDSQDLIKTLLAVSLLCSGRNKSI